MQLRLFTIIFAFAIEACVNTPAYCAGDAVSAKDQDLFSFYCKLLHARYTLRANADRIALYGPPLTGSQFAKTHVPPKRVTRIVNSPVQWELYRLDDGGTENEPFSYWVERTDYRDPFGEAFFLPPRRETIPSLLDAMEDSKKFVSAHWLLRNESGEFQPSAPPAAKDRVIRQADGSFVYDLDGLKMNLSHLKKTAYGVAVGGPIVVYSCEMNVDVSQFPALLARWHRRLDTSIVSVSCSQFTAAMAALLWLARMAPI